MANSKSTEKRQRQNEKRRQRNKSLKTRVKNKKQQVLDQLEAENVSGAEETLNDLYGICDRAAKKGAIHKNKASRIKSRMTQKVNDAKEEEAS